MNCEKTRALCPSSITSSSWGSERVELGARLVECALRVDQPGMAGRLAQAQQRLEDLDLRPCQPLALHPAEERLAVVVAQLVVDSRAAAGSSSQ